MLGKDYMLAIILVNCDVGLTPEIGLLGAVRKRIQGEHGGATLSGIHCGSVLWRNPRKRRRDPDPDTSAWILAAFPSGL
ncbi:UNVERIFIED_CONTAM: hypothetical protein K2H54_001369 [Gekko kuhli]